MTHRQPLICSNIAHLVWHSVGTNWEIPAGQRRDLGEVITWKHFRGLSHGCQGCWRVGCHESVLGSVWISLPACCFRFAGYRNLGQIITLLLSLQGWGADLKLTFRGPGTGLSPSLAKAAAKVLGIVCHLLACWLKQFRPWCGNLKLGKYKTSWDASE